MLTPNPADIKNQKYDVLPFIFMPWTLPNAQLNTAHFIKKLPLANRTADLTAEDYANPLINK